MEFHEDKIVLRFPAMSDLHIMGEGQETSQKLDRAFSYLKQFGKLDAVFFPGDLTDFGLPEQMTEFRNIMQRHFDLDETKLLFAIGNHELYRHELLGAPLTVAQDFIRIFMGKVFEGATKEEVEAGNHFRILNGFPFIMVNAYRYSGGVDFRPEDKAWLEKVLDRAEAETDSNKPIFVCAHPMIVNTCYGSNYAGGDGGYWSSSQLYPILAKHPRSIYFSGHLHFPLQHERDIWQKEFTAIGTSSCYFASLEAEDPQNLSIPFADIVVGSEPNDAHMFSQGMLVEVDDCNQIKITRLDFYKQQVIKEPWFLPAVGEGAERPYAAENRKKALPKPPVFPKNAAITENRDKLNDPASVYSVTFTAAQSDDMVESYRLRFIDDETGKCEKVIGLYSDFYRADKKEEMANVLEKSTTPGKLLPFTFYGNGTYHLELTAQDFFGQTSKPLVSPSYERIPEKAEDAYLNLSTDIRFGSFIRFSHLPLDRKLIDGTDYTCWPPYERGDGASALVITPSNGGDRAVSILLNSGVYQYYEFKKPIPAVATGADQVWLWLDCGDAVFGRLYFTFVNDGQEYSTDACNGLDMKAYIKEQGVWKAIPFSYDGCLENFGNFKGYIRFSTEYLRHSRTGEVAPLDHLESFRIGFSGENTALKGKVISVGDIKFSKSPKKR